MNGFFNATNSFSLTALQALQDQANAFYIQQEYVPPDPIITGTAYYFSEEGDDVIGLGTKDDPWKSLDRLKMLFDSGNLQAGDGVLFAMGDVFRFTTTRHWGTSISEGSIINGSASAHIVIGRYWKEGEENITDLPKFRGDAVNTPTWTETFVGSGFWETTEPYSERSRVLKNGIEQLQCEHPYDTTDENGPAVGFYDTPEIKFWHDKTNNKWVHRSATDPNGSVWTYSNQHYLLNLNYSHYITINGIDFGHTEMWGIDISSYNCSHITIQNCKISRHSHSGVTLHGDWQNNGANLEVIYNTFDSGFRLNYWFDYLHSGTDVLLQNQLNLHGYADNSIVEHNNFIDFGHIAVSYVYPTSIIQGGKWRYNYFDAPNSAYARPMGGVDGGFNGLEIAYNIFNRCSIQNQVQGTNVHWHHNIFSNWKMGNKSMFNVGTDLINNVSVPVQGRADGHIIENNIFYNLEMQGIKIYANSAYTGDVRNNIFYNCGTNLADPADRGVGLTFIGWETSDESATLQRTSQNNLFYDTTKTGFNVFAIGTQELNTIFYKLDLNGLNNAQWTSSNNLETNPYFADITTFTLQDISPAIGAGIQPTATIDYNGEPIIAPYNIGLYDSQEVVLDDIRIDPTNNWFWQYKGNSVMLVGGSSDDNLFQTTGTTLTNELNLIKLVGGNFIRNVMSPLDVYPFYFNTGTGLYDLNLWNDEYWDRFVFFLNECHARDIIVQIELWNRFDFYNTNWTSSPWHPDNNSNYTNAESGLADLYDVHPNTNANPFFMSVPDINNNTVLLPYQEAFIAKIMSYTLNYPNILYVMDNETSGHPAWGHYWSNYTKGIASSQSKTIFTTEMWDEWNFTSTSQHTATWDNIPAIYDFTDASQSTHYEGDTHWNNIMFTRGYLSAPCPINLVKIYGYDNPNWWFGYIEHGVNRFWIAMLGGAAAGRFHRPDTGGYGLGILSFAQNQLKVFRMIEAITPWQNRIPDTNHSKLGNRGTSEAYLSYDLGNAFVVYFYKQRGNGTINSVDLDLTTEGGIYGIRWYNLDDASVSSLTYITPPLIHTLTEPSRNNYGHVAVIYKL